MFLGYTRRQEENTEKADRVKEEKDTRERKKKQNKEESRSRRRKKKQKEDDTFPIERLIARNRRG